MFTFNGDPTQVRATGATTVSLTSELKGLLGRMLGAQEALRAALVSPGAGAATQTSLTNAGTAGNKLAATLLEIADNLSLTATKVEDQDTQAASQVNAAAGAGLKVDTQSWA
ncbi:hypothetical protein [Nocardia brasiliensis]|uniref:hypothetical protein n=1 Tax=Nocardia brasiliensis TaxID=37326 RepID=UPI00245784AD|nr:hypothetical protein [Nocardia brasiliensis]